MEDIRRRFNPVAMTMTFGILFPRRHTWRFSCPEVMCPRLGYIFKVHKSLYMYIP
ncbi:hypothetical protein YC2023_119420 [Brassica napus]